MSKQFSTLTFITVNYNGLDDTRALFRSIAEAKLTMDYTIVVIDNGSLNNEWEVLINEFPYLLGKRSDVNLGFAGGNNLAMELVEADYYYYLNNDTLLPKDADAQIIGMLDFLQTDSSIGGVSPKIKYFEPDNLLQFAGCTALTSITLRNRQIGYQEIDEGQYDNILPIPYMHGAAMLVRKEVLADVGLLPELYFLYYEELDWCHAITKKFKLFYYPKAYIFHKESASTGLDSPFKTYYLSRNRIIYAFRNRKGLIRVFSIIYLSVVQVVKSFLFVVKGQINHCKSTMKGTIDAIRWIINRGNN